MARRSNRRGRGRGAGRRAPRRSAARALTVAALLLVVAAVGAVAWLLIVYPQSRPAGTGREEIVELPAEPTIGGVVDRLTAAGVLDHPWAFAAYLRVLGVEERLRAGPVTVRDDMSPSEMVRQVARGFGHGLVRVTIPEGWTRFDIAARLERLRVCDGQAFLAGTASPAVLRQHDIGGATVEGYLFPDTYEMREDLPPEDVIDRMVRNFRRRVLPLVDEHSSGLAALKQDLGWDLREVITMASIVEKEAAAREERPVIAGVFLNRLRSETFRPRRLQADPTIIYGCLAQPEVSDPCRAFDGRDITRAMLRDPLNPYNTYRHEGLPPGPIANPGAHAIEAVLSPAAHDYLYFVARGAGRHAFSATLEEHDGNVRRHVLGQ